MLKSHPQEILLRCKLATACRQVRQRLLSLFADAEDNQARVTANSYLDLESHWKVLLLALFEFNTCGANRECDVDSFCIVSLKRGEEANGQVVGNIRAPNRIVVMNSENIHFDPCLPR